MAPLIVYGTYGVLASASDDTAALAYLIALIAIVFTALSYGKLARLFPVAGSAYTYTRKTFNAHLGFMIGWATLLDYFFLPMVIWLIGAAYLSAAFPTVPSWIWIVAFIVLTSALNILGIELANRFNIVLMVVQLAIVALFVVLCCHYVTAAMGPGGLISAEPFFKPHVPFSATMAGAAIAAYSYLGFDAVSTLTEETIEPEKTMPRAIVLIALIGGAIFVIAAYTVQLAHPGAVFKDPDSAAFEVARMVGGDIFVTVFLAGLILAQFASGISAQASVGRLLYAMGRDEVLPRRIFGFVHPKFKTPAINIAIAGAGWSDCLEARRRDFHFVHQLRRVSRVHRSQSVRRAPVLSRERQCAGHRCVRRAVVPGAGCACGSVAAGEPGEDGAGIGRDLVRAGTGVSRLAHTGLPPCAAGSGRGFVRGRW